MNTPLSEEALSRGENILNCPPSASDEASSGKQGSSSHPVAMTHFAACIIEAARAGNRPKLIAEDIGTTPKSVKVILSKARRKGIEIPRFDAHGNIRRVAA